jgi:2-C-methyl-D-erythritol 4-phosphate cytidylyltransferase
LIEETILSAKKQGTGVAANKVTDTIKEVDRGVLVARTVDRSKLWAVQTPQTFRVDWLNKAYENAKQKKLTVTDEASAVEALGESVHLVPAPVTNIKITTPADLTLAAMILRV